MRLWPPLALLCALIAGCGEDGDASSDAAAADLVVSWIDPDGDPPIVGSLTVNPADSTHFTATNTGPFRVPAGSA